MLPLGLCISKRSFHHLPGPGQVAGHMHPCTSCLFPILLALPFLSIEVEVCCVCRYVRVSVYVACVYASGHIHHRPLCVGITTARWAATLLLPGCSIVFCWVAGVGLLLSCSCAWNALQHHFVANNPHCCIRKSLTPPLAVELAVEMYRCRVCVEAEQQLLTHFPSRQLPLACSCTSLSATHTWC